MENKFIAKKHSIDSKPSLYIDRLIATEGMKLCTVYHGKSDMLMTVMLHTLCCYTYFRWKKRKNNNRKCFGIGFGLSIRSVIWFWCHNFNEWLFWLPVTERKVILHTKNKSWRLVEYHPLIYRKITIYRTENIDEMMTTIIIIKYYYYYKYGFHKLTKLIWGKQKRQKAMSETSSSISYCHDKLAH